MYRPEFDGEHTAGSVQQRDRQHGWTDCSCSAAESDAFPGGPRHARQSRIRDRSRLVTGLTALSLVRLGWLCGAAVERRSLHGQRTISVLCFIDLDVEFILLLAKHS